MNCRLLIGRRAETEFEVNRYPIRNALNLDGLASQSICAVKFRGRPLSDTKVPMEWVTKYGRGKIFKEREVTVVGPVWCNDHRAYSKWDNLKTNLIYPKYTPQDNNNNSNRIIKGVQFVVLRPREKGKHRYVTTVDGGVMTTNKKNPDKNNNKNT